MTDYHADEETQPQEVKAQYTKDQLESAAKEIKALTPEMYLDMIYYINKMEAALRLPEAAVRANTTLYGENGGMIFIEVKGAVPSVTTDALLEEAKRLYKRNGFLPARPGAQTPPGFASASARPAAPANTPNAPGPAPASAPADPTPAQAPVSNDQEMLIATMTFTPRAGGRGDLLFFQPNHRYKDLSVNNWEISKIIQLLQKTGDWKPEHFTQAATWNVNYIVAWREGKPSGSGAPYKNVTDVRLA